MVSLTPPSGKIENLHLDISQQTTLEVSFTDRAGTQFVQEKRDTGNTPGSVACTNVRARNQRWWYSGEHSCLPSS